VRDDPLFVVGAPRSGTSLLQYLLAAHPDLAYADVADARLWGVRPLRLAARTGLPVLASRALHRLLLPRPGTTRYESALAFLGLDPELPVEGLFLWADRDLGVHAEELEPAHLREQAAAAARIRSRYAQLCRRQRKERFVDKAPAFTRMLDAIRELFPGAHVVHIVRDGRAVANSIVYGLRHRGKQWALARGADPVEAACRTWAELVRAGRRGEELFPGRYHELRYERLVAATRDELLQLFERTSLAPWGADLYPEQLEDRNYKWQRPGEESFGDVIWTDRAAIEPAEQGRFETIRPLLEELGYVEPGAALSRPSPSSTRAAG
jgi:hypothetical protein